MLFVAYHYRTADGRSYVQLFFLLYLSMISIKLIILMRVHRVLIHSHVPRHAVIRSICPRLFHKIYADLQVQMSTTMSSCQELSLEGATR